jgi:hypothetical protein
LTALATESRNARPLAGLICVVASATFIATLMRLLGSPLRFDESEWPPQAIGILRHGVPKLLYSEESVIYSTPNLYYGFDAHYGMWHPPAYLYSLAVTAGLFGTGSVAMRATSLAWFLLSLVVVWKITGLLLDKGTPLLVRAVPVALLVMTPLLMEGSLLLDIDNTSLCFAILLLLWLYLKEPDTLAPRRLGLLALAFAFALASKLTTPYMLVASIAVYQLLRRQPVRAFVQATVIGVGGSAVFGAAYLAYCALLRYPAGFMFQFSYLGKTGQFLHNPGLIGSFRSIYWNLTWISLPIALLIASAIALRTIAFVRARRAQPIDLLLIFCVVGLLAYVPWAATIGKYTAPPVATGVLAAGIEFGNRLMALQKPVLRSRDLIVAGGAVAAAVLLLLVGTPLQFRPPGFYVSTGLGQSIVNPPHVYLLLKLVAFALLLFGAWRLLRRRPRSEVWTVAAVAYLLIANPIDVAKLAVVAPGSSPYRAYHETGFDATVGFLNATQSNHPGEVILAPKDIGFYFHGSHYGLEDVAGGAVGDISRQPDVRYVVDSTLYPTVSGLDGLMRDRSLREVKHIGAFVVYENPGYNGA